eukprot:2603519-Pyramimonas_sp.AAC.1
MSGLRWGQPRCTATMTSGSASLGSCWPWAPSGSRGGSRPCDSREANRQRSLQRGEEWRCAGGSSPSAASDRQPCADER